MLHPNKGRGKAKGRVGERATVAGKAAEQAAQRGITEVLRAHPNVHHLRTTGMKVLMQEPGRALT
jgi:hypothetical protein